MNDGLDKTGPSKKDVPYFTKGNVTEQGIITFFMNQFNSDADYDKSVSG
jgi:hypothetical protein